MNIYPYGFIGPRTAADVISDEYTDIVALRHSNGDLTIEQSAYGSMLVGARFTEEEYYEWWSIEAAANTERLLKMNEKELANHFKQLKLRSEEAIAKIVAAH